MSLPIGADDAAAPPAGALQFWLDHTRDMLLLADKACRVTWCNASSERVLAQPRSATRGRMLSAALPLAGAHRLAWVAACEQMQRGEPPGELEVELDVAGAAAQSGQKWLRIVMHRIDAGTGGADSHWLCLMTDVSESRRNAREVQELRDWLALGKSFGRLGAWERDLRFDTGRWDASVYRLFGFDPAQGVPTLERTLSHVHPQDRGQLGDGAAYTRSGRHECRYRVVRPDGSTRWLHSQWEVRTAPDGTPERAFGLLLDDTEAFELAHELDSTSEQLELAIGLGNIAIWRHDLKSDRIAFNERAHHVFGLAEGTTALSLVEFRARIHPDDLGRVATTAADALDSQQPTDIEGRFQGVDGQWRTVMTRRVVERGTDGTPIAFVGIALDVTRDADERRRTAEQLHHLEAAASAARVGIWSTDEQTGRGQWNEPMFALIGRPVAPIAPSREEWMTEIIDPIDVPRLLAARAAISAAPEGLGELTYRVRLPDGTTRWLEDRVRRELLQGRPTLFGVTVDVTERVRAEAALRDADQRAALATRSAGIGTWEMGLVESDERWDAQMFRLRGIPVRDRPPSRDERLAMLHPDDRPLVFDSRSDMHTHTGAAKYEFRVRWPDGSERWLASRSIAVQDDAGRPIRRVGVNWDITESKLAEAAREQSALAQRENLAKSRFLSRVSHELRTPLNAMLGFTQLMQAEASITESQATRLALIRSAGEHLLVLINDMLDLTGMDTGDFKLEPQPVVLDDLVRETLRLVEPLALAHQVTLRAAALPGIVRADPTRLRQVLINLLTNGIKYNRPNGSVTVEARSSADRLQIEVRDTGRGIAAHQIEHVFEPFNRLGVESEGVEGSGIGLVIVKALVERMGGEVTIESELARGSCFRVSLPALDAADAACVGAAPAGHREAKAATRDAVAARDAARAESAPVPAASGRVLYIEDNAVNVLLVGQIVALRPGLEMLSAPTGAQGVALALAHRPELVLVDMQLPDFDGFEVLRRLRAARGGEQLHCIALSANALPEDIERALGAGFADYWTKPIDFKQFLAGLDAAFAAPRGAG